MVINDKIKCLCLNSSYSGKHCEITKLKPVTKAAPTSRTRLTTTSESSTSYFEEETSRHTTTESPEEVNLSKGAKLAPFTSSPQPPPPRISFHTNKKITPTTRAYFWQCPSNCFYSSGHGFCALSQSGYPACVCHIGWTGIDCSQKNYCADNDCSNNSTCVNFPERR